MKDMKIKSLNFPDEKVLLEREEIDIAKLNEFFILVTSFCNFIIKNVMDRFWISNTL
jgi:hypothetical protein